MAEFFLFYKIKEIRNKDIKHDKINAIQENTLHA